MTEPSLPETVRAGAERVAERAKLVAIDEDNLTELTKQLASSELPAGSLDPDFHYLRDEATSALFTVTLDAVNFGSGYFPHLRKRGNKSGYFTIAGALTDWFDARDGEVTAADLCELDAARCAKIFCQESTPAPIAELMDLFARALRDLGEFLLTNYDGSVLALIESAGGSACRLARSLTAMPFFQDVAQYDDEPVPLYKRAQITAADLSLACPRTCRFDDLDKLTIFADNLVPHVLRVDGVLCYDAELAECIESGQTLASGSVEEVEIRASALHAVERIVEGMRQRGRDGATAMRLDYKLWNLGQDPRYKATARHRTRCVYY